MVITKLNDHRQGKLRTSASRGRKQELPTAAWVRCVAMIADKNKQAEMESEQKLPEDFQPDLMIH